MVTWTATRSWVTLRRDDAERDVYGLPGPAGVPVNLNVDIGVIGTGAIAPTATDDIAALGNELHARLADIDSVWGWGGLALACEPGVGTTVMLDDWRDVDAIICSRRRLPARPRTWRSEIGISVESIPVPAAA